MLKDERDFNEIGKDLFMKGKLQEFEKKHGEIKGRMAITKGQIPKNMLNKLQPELLKTSNWFVVEGSFDSYDWSIGMIVGTNPVKALSEGWLIPQTKTPGVEPAKKWQEFFEKKVLESVDDHGTITLPIFSWLSDQDDLTEDITYLKK